MNVFSQTDCGRRRSNNEDSYVNRTYESFHLSVIADGVGGHRAGEVASSLAVESILSYIDRHADRVDFPSLLQEAVEQANERLLQASEQSPEYAGMGTTVDVALLVGPVLYIGHVGDSRVYRFHNGRLQQLTCDHSIVGDLVRRGVLTEEEAKCHPDRHAVTRALGVQEEVLVDVLEEELQEGDWVLLCTDGLSNMVEFDEIEKILTQASDPSSACRRLVDCANAQGGVDNITVTIFEYRSATWIE